MLRIIGVYARISTEEQKDGYSIESQIRLNTDYALKHFTNDKDRIKVYCDEGYSGTNLKRPGIQEAMTDIGNDIVSHFVIYEQDRLCRNSHDFQTLLKLFDDYNVEFHLSKRKFKFHSATDKLMARSISNFDEFFPDLVSEKTKASFLEVFRQGKFPFAHIPYGYISVGNKKIAPVAEELEIVKEVFGLYTISQLGTNSISKYLIDKYKSDKFTGQWVLRVLKRTYYTGTFKYQDHEFSNCIFLDTVSLQQFEVAQKLLLKKNKKRINNYLFSDKLECTECLELLDCTSTNKRNRTYLYYQCKNKICKNFNLRINEDRVIAKYGDAILRKYNKKYCLKNYQHSKLIEKEKANLISLLEELEESAVAGTVSPTINAEIDILKDKIAKLSNTKNGKYLHLKEVPIDELIRFIICDVNVLKVDLKNI